MTSRIPPTPRPTSPTRLSGWRRQIQSGRRPARPLLLGGTLALVLTVLAALLWVGGSPTAAQDDGTQPPARPGGLEIATEAGSLDVSVDWDDVDGANSYLVRWREAGPGNKLNEGVRPTSSSTEITVADYGEWVVRLEACNDAGCGLGVSQRVEIIPARPINLAVSATAGSLNLTATWDAVAGADSYSVRWRTPTGAFETANLVAATGTSTGITVADYGRWVVRVEACNGEICGRGATQTVGVTPARPENLVVSATQGNLTLSASWDESAGTHRYRVRWRAADGEFQPDDLIAVSETSATFTVSDFGQWEVRVEACNGGCAPGEIQTVNAQPLPTPPPAPSGLTAIARTPTISLSWTDPEDSAISKYQHRVSADGGTTWNPDWTDVSDSDATTTSHTVTGLANDTTYTIELRAVRGQDIVGAASSITATPATPPAPSGLTATAGPLTIGLSWTDPEDPDISKYQYRLRTGDQNFSVWTDILGSGSDTTGFTLLGLRPPRSEDDDYDIELRKMYPRESFSESANGSATPFGYSDLARPGGRGTLARDQELVWVWGESYRRDTVAHSLRYRTWNDETHDWSDFTAWQTFTPRKWRTPHTQKPMLQYNLTGLTNGTAYDVDFKLTVGETVFIFDDPPVARPRLTQGTEGSDYILGPKQWTTLSGLGGDDMILSPARYPAGSYRSGDERDVLNGGDGDDVLIARTHRAVLNGGAGNDILSGGPHTDTLNGGDGNDILSGGGWDSLGGWASGSGGPNTLN